MSSGDAATDALLDRLESKGKAIRDLRATMKKEDIDTFPVPDTRSSEGVLLFRRFEANPKFLIHFDKRTAGGVVHDRPENRETFLFDGQWMWEKQDKTRTILKRQILREGEHMDVFKLGEGKFPIPIGQSRHDMLTHFSITREPPKADDPSGCDHLACTVRPESELANEYKKVEFFVDRKLDLPVRITAERAKDEKIVQVTLSDVRLNTGLAASEFETSSWPKDYALTVEPLPNAARVPVVQP